VWEKELYVKPINNLASILTMDSTIDRMLDTMADLHTSTSLDSSSVFYGFTNEDICYVSSDVWEIQPKLRSCTIQVHHLDAFDNLESEVKKLYGSPQIIMANNGNIYRGQLPTTTDNTVQVTITFYKSTLLVRVQGSGYAMWVNKVLPSLADIVVNSSKTSQANDVATCPSTPIRHNKSPISSMRTITSTPSNFCRTL
jgi:hypothetical protein